MGEECRHGLDYGLCDACFPPIRPAEAVVAPTARVTRSRAATSKRLASESATGIDLTAQRLYHVTHIDNLASILETEALLADAAGAAPAVDISSQQAREARRTITVDDDGSAVSQFVPFFFSPSASVWSHVRASTTDPRISVRRPASEFVLLVSSIKSVADAGAQSDIVFSDRDAAHPLARFATASDAGDRMLRKITSPTDESAILEAELLVRERVPFSAVSVVTVANDRSRNAVKELLRASSFAPRVAIHPPWFAADLE